MTTPDETATIDRDLAAVEAALASGAARHAGPEARELQELALALAAEAPQPRAEFADELTLRVERGFPAPTRAHRRARRRRGSLGELADAFAPLLGIVATILLIVGVVLAAGGGSSNDDSAGSSAGGGGAVQSAPGGGGGAEKAPGGGTADSSDLRAAPRSGGFAPNQPNRAIERTFSMELSVPVR